MDLVLAYDERGIESISFLVLLWTVYEDNRWPMIPNRVFLWTSTSCRERHGKILKSTWSMIFITLCEDLEKMENRVSCKSISWYHFIRKWFTDYDIENVMMRYGLSSIPHLYFISVNSVRKWPFEQSHNLFRAIIRFP